ncbi:MAG: aminopeptidase [Spirochaetes bacterium]|nr:aminopeptidase [Spirochaetota bacterium]
MNQEIINKYAELVVKVGVNLIPGQCLFIWTDPAHYQFAVVISEKAYQLGAKWVEIQIKSNSQVRARIDYSEGQYLDFLPNYKINESYELISEKWAFIKIDCTEEIHDLKGCDADKLSQITKARSEKLHCFNNSLITNQQCWSIIDVPGPKWAAEVFQQEPSEQLTKQLWDKIIPILKLDQPDPVQAWQSHSQKLIKRANKLTEMRLKKMVFSGPGTELTLGLNTSTCFTGGGHVMADGRLFLPNIPTEEVFTTPDYRLTEGKVQITRPVKVMESLVEDAWFEFKEGKVINYGAKKGKSIVEKYLQIDEGAGYLGEVALVDEASAIAQSGLTFSSILYDENASSHIALGKGFSALFENKAELTNPEKMKAAGCNHSLVHNDFMIGSENIDVTGFTENGEEVEILKNGLFQI